MVGTVQNGRRGSGIGGEIDDRLGDLLRLREAADRRRSAQHLQRRLLAARLRDEPGPFAGRDDLDLVVSGLDDLMAMRTAGDLVIYGLDAADGNVSYIAEIGAHAGPSYEEMHTFLVAPVDVALPAALTHPVQLYDVFMRYQPAEAVAA